MNRDFGFWKVEKKMEISNLEIYSLLSKETYVANIEELSIDGILNDFGVTFRGWRNCSKGLFVRNEESFQLMFSKQFVRVDCYNMKLQHMNAIIDIMIKYNCPLYDPVIDVRFDS